MMRNAPLTYVYIFSQVCQFLKRGADIKVKDKAGNDPLSIAVSAANADIVTL